MINIFNDNKEILDSFSDIIVDNFQNNANRDKTRAGCVDLRIQASIRHGAEIDPVRNHFPIEWN